MSVLDESRNTVWLLRVYIIYFNKSKVDKVYMHIQHFVVRIVLSLYTADKLFYIFKCDANYYATDKLCIYTEHK